MPSERKHKDLSILSCLLATHVCVASVFFLAGFSLVLYAPPPAALLTDYTDMAFCSLD